MQTPRPISLAILTGVAALSGLLSTWPAHLSLAQAPETNFAGKTVNFVIGFPPGGPQDVQARLLARHLGRHIPGQPQIVPQNMPGAGSYKAASHIYGLAPKDGTAIGWIAPTAATQELLGNTAIQFKTAEFGWIGRLASDTLVTVTWHTAKVKAVADAYSTEAVIGSTGFGSGPYLYPSTMNKVLGTKFKIVSGYQSQAQVFLAMERGEIEGMSTGLITMNARGWFAGKKINLLVQHRTQRAPNLPDVPALVEFARNSDEMELLRLLASDAEIGKTVIAPPGLRDGTLRTLRRAFDAMLADSEFRTQAQKLEIELESMSGEKLQRLIQAVAETPHAIVERAKLLLE